MCIKFLLLYLIFVNICYCRGGLNEVSSGQLTTTVPSETQRNKLQEINLLNNFDNQLVIVGANGELWGIDEITGEHLWTLETNQPIFTFNNKLNSKYNNDDDDEDEKETEEETKNENQFILIPSSKGELFTYINGELQSVGVTVQQLVAGAPLITSDGSYWIASKITDMWAINHRGEVIKSWKSTNEEEMNENKIFLKNNQKYNLKKNNLLVIIRVSYIIQAIDIYSGSIKWNMTVSEFISENQKNTIFSGKLDLLEDDYSEVDYDDEGQNQRKVLVSSDGSIFSYDEKEKHFLWKTSFPAGAISIFNLRKQRNNEKEYYQFYKSRNPILPPNLSIQLPGSSNTKQSEENLPIFIGVYNNHLYAIPISFPNPFVFPIAVETDYLQISPGGSSSTPNPWSFEEYLSTVGNCNEFSPNFPMCLVGSLNYLVPKLSPSSLSTSALVDFYSNNRPSLEYLQFLELPSSPSNQIPLLPALGEDRNQTIILSDPSALPFLDIFSLSPFSMVFVVFVNLLLIALILLLCILLRNSKIKNGNATSTPNVQIVEEKDEDQIPEPPKLNESAVASPLSLEIRNVRKNKLVTQNHHPPLTIGRLFVDNTILGYGSSGTIVYLGSLDGRKVAVKRMLREYFDLANQELGLLQQSDEHKNVVRYFTHEKDQNFIYLALSYCIMNLEQFITSKNSNSSTNPTTASKRRNNKSNHNKNRGRPSVDKDGKVLVPTIDVRAYHITLPMLRELLIGLDHIHCLHIVHRDLKPHNILMDPSGTILKISDMGLAKKLEKNQHSFSSNSYGTLGWQAPEQITKKRQTYKLDIFSMGCILYYCLTNGKHPFGEHIERENNIVNDKYSLKHLNSMPLAQHLIENMIKNNPAQRITAKNASMHPLFWSAEKKLDFLRITSDRLEVEKPNAPIVIAMENYAPKIIGSSPWLNKIDAQLRKELQTSKYRKYNGDIIRDLLRVIRNKIHHYHDLPDDARAGLGSLPDGFLAYWETRFPHLILCSYLVTEQFCKIDLNFKQFF